MLQQNQNIELLNSWNFWPFLTANFLIEPFVIVSQAFTNMNTDDLSHTERTGSSPVISNERVIYVDPQNTVVGVDRVPSVGDSNVPYDAPDPHEELNRILSGSCTDISPVKQSEYSENSAIEDDLNPAKHEEQVGHTDLDVMEKLREVAQFVQDHFPSQVQCLLMYDINQMPFLTVRAPNGVLLQGPIL